MSGGLLLPGAPRTPPDAAKTPGLQIGLSNRLRGLSNRSIVVVRNYEGGPITAEPCRAKTRPLRPSSNLFRPRPNPAHILAGISLGSGGGAGYCPRVRKVYYDGHLSPYPACAGTPYIGPEG